MKRRNSQELDGAPRLKTRVQQRHHDDINAIYDKTIRLLQKGANKKNNNDDLDSLKTPCLIMNNSKNPDSKVQRLKQMSIANNGSLYLNGNTLTTDSSVCMLCNSTLYGDAASCSYCEFPQCSSCAEKCSACNLPTCHKCSIDSYGENNGIYCFSCCR